MKPYMDYDAKFHRDVLDFVITPFGRRLNQDLVEVCAKLDFPEKILRDLKVAIDGEPRKNLRKP